MRETVEYENLLPYRFQNLPETTFVALLAGRGRKNDT